MNRRFRTWWLFVPLAVAGLSGVWWIRAKANHAERLASPARARREHRPIPVRTALVSAPAVSAVVGATAVTTPSKQAVLRVPSSPRFREINPRIQGLHIENGQHVEAGAVCIELETALFEKMAKDAAGAVEAAEASVALTKALITENAQNRRIELETAVRELVYRRADDKFANSDLERLERLYTDKQASLNEFLRAAATHQEARYTLSRAVLRERVATAEMILGPLRDQDVYQRSRQRRSAADTDRLLALADLDRCRIVSTLSGLVENLTIVAGVGVQSSESLATILQVDPIHVKVDFPQERIDRLSVGLRAEVVLDTFPKETFEGKVVRIASRVDVQRRVLPVLVEVANPDHRIKVGVSGYVRIDLPQAIAAVPSLGVTDLGTVASAFVVEDGRAHIRAVKTGAYLGDGFLEIREGLNVGDEVVIFGQQYLRDHDAVDTNWRRWARRD